MRLKIIIAAASAGASAVSANPPASGTPAQTEHESDRHDPVLVSEADGAITIRRALRPYADRLDPIPNISVRSANRDRVAPTPLGRRRSPAEQAMDEDLERAFEEAMDMARFGTPD